MERHPMMLFLVIIAWVFIAAYHIIKVVVPLSISLYKWIAKKIEEKQLERLAVEKISISKV
jgi:protein-S-isoprenylcysteine O-methyltransferase Ste14